MKRLSKNQGFTVIELIVVLMILSIVAFVLSNVIVYGVQGYFFARNANQSSQKAQLAMTRLNTELTNMTNISLASADQIDFTTPRNSPSCLLDEGCQYRIKRTGANLTLETTDTVPLVSGEQVLIAGLNVGNDGKTFLSYCKQNETTDCTWTTADGLNALATIKIQIALDFPDSKPLYFHSSINPRGCGIITAPNIQ